MLEKMSADFRDSAPLSAAGAATIILDGVRSGAWRILVGQDAVALDAARAREAGRRLRLSPRWPAWRETRVRRRRAADTVTGMQRAGMTTTPEPFPAR